MRRYEWVFAWSTAVFLLQSSAAHAAGQGPDRLSQIAVIAAGLALVPSLLYFGDGYKAVGLQPSFKILLIFGAAASLLATGLGAARVIGAEFAAYGSVACGMLLIGLIPWPAVGGSPSASSMLKLGGAGLAAAALTAIGAALDADSAAYPVAMAGLWYGAFLITNAFATPPVAGADSKKMGYAGVALVTLGVLLLAHLLGQSISDASGMM